MESLPKGVQRVRKRLADGSEAVYFYWRATGARLPPPSDPDFSAALEAAKQPVAHESPMGTFGALLAAYRRGPSYRALKPNTAKAYDRALEKVRGWAPLRVENIKRADVLSVRDAMAIHAPMAANQLVMVLANVFAFAVDRGMREFNPCRDIRRLKGGEHQRWPETAIQYALTHFPEDFRRAVVLALYTGQREGDCIGMTWAQYDGAGIQVKQGKTGASLWIPAHRILKKELNSWKAGARDSVTILTNSLGRPWRTGAFATQFCELVHQHDALKGLVFHGLRKSAAARLAESGCSEREIMAITGHKSSQMVDHYVKQADQKTRAIAAIKRLEDHR